MLKTSVGFFCLLSFLFYKHPYPPLTPLSQKRERGRGRKRKGEYINVKGVFNI